MARGQYGKRIRKQKGVIDVMEHEMTNQLVLFVMISGSATFAERSRVMNQWNADTKIMG